MGLRRNFWAWDKNKGNNMAITKKTHSRQDELQTLLNAAAERSARAETEQRAAREQLERAVQLARGTGDVQRAARAATESGVGVAKVEPKVEPETLEQAITRVLLGESAPMTFAPLCRAVNASPGRVSATMREMRKSKRVYNLGSEDHPRWIAIIGDKTSAAELNAWVKRLLTLTPMTFAQLLAATGARRGRVSGALVQLQRDPETRKRLQNLGNDRTFVWFLPSNPATTVKQRS